MEVKSFNARQKVVRSASRDTKYLPKLNDLLWTNGDDDIPRDITYSGRPPGEPEVTRAFRDARSALSMALCPARCVDRPVDRIADGQRMVSQSGPSCNGQK